MIVRSFFRVIIFTCLFWGIVSVADANPPTVELSISAQPSEISDTYIAADGRAVIIVLEPDVDFDRWEAVGRQIAAEHTFVESSDLRAVRGGAGLILRLNQPMSLIREQLAIIDQSTVRWEGSLAIITREQREADRLAAIARGEAGSLVAIDAQPRGGVVELAELEVATARRDFTRRHWDRTESLGAQRMISDQEVDEIQTDYELAEGELRRARAALGLRSVRAPFNGVIVERRFDRGDVVRGEPIFRLLSLDPLYVEVVMTVSSFGQVTRGDQFRIRVPDLDQEMVAEVTVVDRVVDPRSSTFRVRLELPNTDLLVPSGLQCEWLGPA